MRYHTQDDFDGGRGPSLTTRPELTTTNGTRECPPEGDPRRRWMEAGANDDLAFALAMLALTEGGDL
jgi:hypothetical protein